VEADIERSETRRRYRFTLRGRERVLGERTWVMGVVNVTPDSFSDGGAHFSTTAAVDRGLALVADGADIVDVGGESTRPGAASAVDAAEECRSTPRRRRSRARLWRPAPTS
jgi:dihydropteroate synthase